jgi:hypothetical protein
VTVAPPSPESLVRLLFAVGGIVTGVASTVAGSWISSKIHVYHENRKAHLEDIKQSVLIPIRNVLDGEFAGLVTHKSSAVLMIWGTYGRKEIASVTDHQTEDGPLLVPALPDISRSADTALYADAKKKHFSELVKQAEQFGEVWRAHANECHRWVVRVSQEILTKSEMKPFPVAQHGLANIDHRKLGLFVYRRLFGCTPHSLLKHARNPPPADWTLEGFEGTSAVGTEQQMADLVSVLDDLIVRERTTADGLQADARVLEQRLASLRAELNYAIAHRHLRNKCDLVPCLLKLGRHNKSADSVGSASGW